jgi:hypothetical protein
MKYNIFLDVYFYLNWLCALLGIWLINKAKFKSIDRTIDIIFSFVFLLIAVAGLLYLSWKFGDYSIQKMKEN